MASSYCGTMRSVGGVRGGAVALAALLIAGTAAGQARPDPPPPSVVGERVTVVPAPEYEASSFRRTVLGGGWRDVWGRPVDAEVFGFDEFEGGVRWTERGGGNQSVTLHLESVDGWREYRFRSVNKYPQQWLPPELLGTMVGGMVSDAISLYFPAAPLLVPPFLEALDLLHVKPVLRILPDDPVLGVYQDTLAGMLGTVELRPNEAPGDEPGFAGSESIKGSEAFLDDLEASKGHRLDERELLASRLLDFLINDTDRTRDNMRWARYGQEGDYRWRPVPIDRDWAFIDADGWVMAAVRIYYPKMVGFGRDFPSIEALAFSSHQLDRRLLQRLTRRDFEEVAGQVMAAMTDPVIEAGIAEMPERWRRETDAPERIRTVLRARREGLHAIALDFYDYLARDVDVRGTDESDVATVERFVDGRVRVAITWPDGEPRAGEPFYERIFLPSETDEVRLYLHGGDDLARVVGAASGGIVVRIIGGGGDDELVDEAGGGATHLYDDRGDNRLSGDDAHIDTADWDAPEPNEGLRVGSGWAPDWDGETRWNPTIDHVDVGGLVVGGGPTWIDYGFRRLPHHRKVDLRLLYAAGANRPGATLAVDQRFENSPLALTLQARVILYDALRFNGFGNEAPDAGDAGLVAQDLISIAPALTWHIGTGQRRPTGNVLLGETAPSDGLRPVEGSLAVGPVFLWTDPRPEETAPIATADPPGDRSLARAGLRTALYLDRTDRAAAPRRGWKVEAEAAAYPVAGDATGAFGDASARATAYLPLPGPPFLALRLGGRAATDDAPVQHTAWIGGRTTVRGFRWQRYRGDAAAYGSAELRVPVAPVELLLRWNMGIFGLVDAGRVWFDGESPGGWHTGVGGGLWLDALGKAISIAFAHGEQDRVYLQLGLSY